jgi:hypothetical protein
VGGLGAGLVFGLVFMLLIWIRTSLREPDVRDFGLLKGLIFGLAVGLIGGLMGGLGAGLAKGLSFSEIETRAVPNEGIHRSAQSALAVGLGVGPVFGLVVGWVIALGVVGFGSLISLGAGTMVRLSEQGGWLLVGLGAGLAAGLGVGLQAGGEACLKHVVLRLRLIRNGSTPWNYVRFLDHAAERILLRKVGGGYAFIHRMLLEHFAARYVEPSVIATSHPKPLLIDEEP